jgi:serine/threonine protein kinase
MLPSLQGKVLGKYRVLEPLGRGGMARVYRGYHPELERHVAIKVLCPELVGEPFLARFQREARSVAALRHPNIVQVFDFDVQDGLYYMVMELLEGDTLHARLNDYRVRGQPMPWGDTARILLDVLDGLAYAHSQGVIHRDIKPGNILLTREGQAVLSDFGIAHIVGGTQHTASGAWVGTASYMAPEQGMEGQSDARSDIYSVGVVLYEMLLQRAPFEADTPLALLIKHAREPLPCPRAVDPSIPAPLERVAIVALAKAPEDRYQGAEEMAQAVREAAVLAGIALPDRLPPSHSITIADALAEPVSVLSGTELEAVDPRWGEPHTEAMPVELLPQERVEEWQALSPLGRALREGAKRSLREAFDAIERDVRDLPSAVQAVAQDLAPSAETQAQWRRWQPVTYAVSATLIVNAAVLLLSGVTGWWDVLHVAWPMELFYLAAILSSVMMAADLPLLLGVVGFLAGNGLFLSYCTISGNWRSWIYLPIPDLALGAGCAWGMWWLCRHQVAARRLSRALGRPLAVALFSAGLALLGLGVILGAIALVTVAASG